MNLFKKSESSYFLLIELNWKGIFEILDIDKKSKETLCMPEKNTYKSPNAGGPSGLGIDNVNANYEYCIFPDKMIYDQQLGRFFKSPNTRYSEVMVGKNNKDKDVKIECFFTDLLIDNYAAFSINYFLDTQIISEKNSTTLVILFDSIYLTKDYIKKYDYEVIKCRCLVINKDQNKESVSEIKLTDEFSLRIKTDSQSINDGQIQPFVFEVSNFIKNQN